MIFFEMGVAFDDVRRPVRALFHALQTEHFRQVAHFRELFHVMANFGLLAVTVAFVAVMSSRGIVRMVCAPSIKLLQQLRSI